MVNVDPNSFNQGMYAGSQVALNNLSQYEKAGDIIRADNIRNEISNISNQYAQVGKKIELEDLKNVYSKYGDVDSIERVDQKILQRDSQMFEGKSKIYLDQIDAAQKAGNSDALLSIEQNMNTDPIMKRFIGDIKIQPDNKVSYVLNKDVPVTMTGGKIEPGQAGDQVTAYATKDKNGNTIYLASEIKPSTVSKYRYGGGGAGGGSKNLDTLPVIKLIDKSIRGGVNDKLGIYEQGIEGHPSTTSAIQIWNQTSRSLETERLNNRRNPEALENEQTRLNEAMRLRIIKDYQSWGKSDKTKYKTIDEKFQAFLNKKGVSPQDAPAIVALLTQGN